MKAILYKTDTYYNAISLTAELLSTAKRDLDSPKIVFTPEKFSLMLESKISAKIGGYLNTRVFSFSKFLHYFGKPCKVLSKEASVMVIRKILGEKSLSCFKTYQVGIAQNIYDSIALLKSAKVSVNDVDFASKTTDGVLKNKLCDLKDVFIGYEEFLNTGYTDQSDMLSNIPEILDGFNLSDTDVYLVGFDSWTAQARAIVEKLILKSKSVTAVLVGGENPGVYTNETLETFLSICESNKISVSFGKGIVIDNKETSAILDGLYSEKSFASIKVNTDKIHLCEAKSIKEEVAFIASSIKKNVINGDRYREHGVSLLDATKYYDVIEKVFSEYGVPYYIDIKKSFNSHPLANLVLSYIDVIRKNYSKDAVIELIKNPIFCQDKYLADKFENYVLKYNVNYKKFLEPFGDNATADIELLRKKLDLIKFAPSKSTAGEFADAVFDFLHKIDAENALLSLAEEIALFDQQEAEYSRQAFEVLVGVLNSVKEILPTSYMDLREFKTVLASGFTASEISILPQRNDAVYIGGYRDVGSTVRKHLYAIGLTGDVPEVKQDIAILSDRELSLLSDIKVIIEPKVKAVNNREREIFVTSLTAFTEDLYLTYSIESRDGKAQKPSDAINYLSRIFGLKAVTPFDVSTIKTPSDLADKYLSFGQAEKQFALDVGLYKDKVLKDFTLPSAYYFATEDIKDDGVSRDSLASEILSSVNTEIAKRIQVNANVIKNDTVSVSTIESFYSCPFKCFMDNGVKIYDRETGNIDSNDTGIFIHKVVELYVAKFIEGNIIDLETSDKVCDEIILEVASNDEYARYKEDLKNDNELDRLKEESKRVTRGLFYQLTNTDFKPFGAEVDFGFPKSKFAPIRLKGKKGDTFVRGKIDRLDVTDKYYRIIDYKSGNEKMEDIELFMGKKLQLFLYLNAFKGDKLPVGTYYQLLSADYATSADKCQLDGKTVNDLSVIMASDKTLYAGGKSKIINANLKPKKEGGLTNYKNASLVNQDDILTRMEYAKVLCEKGVDYIKDGVIVASPYSKERKCVCNYCKYASVCGYEENLKGVKRTTLKLAENTIKTAIESISNLGGDTDNLAQKNDPVIGDTKEVPFE